jgi:hypothetical protein
MNKTPEQMMEEHGWIVHYVFETDKREFNGLCNIHTHGLEQNFDHPDFQVVLPLDPKVIHPVLSGMVADVKQGKQFLANVRDNRVLSGMDVMFKEFEENGRTVLRLIVPDPNGLLPDQEGCQEPYSRQFEELPDDEQPNPYEVDLQ